MKLFGRKNKLKEQRALEDPRKPITGAAVDEMLDTGTKSGANVSEKSALEFSAIWAAIRILSESVASLPLLVYERTGDGRRVATEHPVYTLLHDEPSELMTSFVWRETVQAHVTTWGNGYSFIRYRNDGRPGEILPLTPDKTWPVMENGRLRYVTEIDGVQYKLNPMDVLHIPGLGWDGTQGYSPIRMQRESIGLGMSATEYGARFFSNGGTPSGVLEHPDKLSADAAKRLRTDWARLYSGVSNTHKTAVLSEGMKYKQVSLPPEDAQFIETRKFQITDIARIFRIPPHMLADMERSTFGNIEHQSLEFVMHCLRPWLIRWEQELNRKLFLPSEQGRYFVEFKIEGLLRGDIKSRYEAYAIGRNWGWLSINDIRQLENMNPVDNGNDYLQPLNMTIAGSNPDEMRSRLTGLERSAVERIAASEAAAISRALNKDNFAEWAEDYFDKQAERIAKDLQLPLEGVISANRQAFKAIETNPAHWETWRTEQLRGTIDGYRKTRL